MIEKVVPIPFAGRYVSGWMYRTSRWISEHKWKATFIGLGCIAAPIIYEAQVSHASHVVSPEVANHLEYEFRRAGLWERFVKSVKFFSIDNIYSNTVNNITDRNLQTDKETGKEVVNINMSDKPNVNIVNQAELATIHHNNEQSHSNTNNIKSESAVKRSIEDARLLLAQTADPVQRAELEAIIAQEDEMLQKSNNTTLLVKKNQLAAREPFWNVRNSERNWNIMSRDLQQQKDNYWYRMERSKDDDYGRNTYSNELSNEE